MAAII